MKTKECINQILIVALIIFILPLIFLIGTIKFGLKETCVDIRKLFNDSFIF